MPKPYYERDGISIYVGDNRDVLPHVGQVHAVVTDPPSGISFMGKEWDSNKGGRDQWIAWLAETLRGVSDAMLPGAHALIWALPRTSGWTSMAIEDAGLDVRDCITHLFGSGFPKSHNVGNGWGTALKPAAEFWYLARAPFKGTVAANVLAHGTGAINVDASRIGTTKDVPASANGTTGANGIYGGGFHALEDRSGMNPNVGRWPANVILDEAAAEALDAQSGTLTTNPGTARRDYKAGMYGPDRKSGTVISKGDTGGASRFFYVPKASRRERNAGLEGMPERTSGAMDGNSGRSGGRLGGDGSPIRVPTAQNHHPTVKPLALMRYLIQMVTPPEGIVLDPFAGSGSTLVAAAELGFHAIGIELSEEYAEIAARRVDHALNERAKRLPGMETVS